VERARERPQAARAGAARHASGSEVNHVLQGGVCGAPAPSDESSDQEQSAGS
jgi:hypothetical protein